MNYKSDSPHATLAKFDFSRVSFARELRGLTQKDLSGLIRKTPSTISQIESGKLRPDAGTLSELALALNLPTTFFASRDWTENNIRLDACHFRSKAKASQRLRLEAVRHGDVWLWIADRLEDSGVIFPSEDISNIHVSSQSHEDLEHSAVEIRRNWGLGIGPIPNVTLLFESKGIFVIPIAQGHRDLDAFSVWRAGRPVVFLSTNNKTAARARFNLGHELGHLIMHDGVVTGCKNTEKQADYFAGAFLAPRDSFGLEAPRRWDFNAFHKLSLRWKISIESALVRAYQLDRISKSSYEFGMKDLRVRQRTFKLGNEWEHETPVLIAKAIELVQDHYDFSDLVQSIGMHAHEVTQHLGMLVPEHILTSYTAKPESTQSEIIPSLRLVSKD